MRALFDALGEIHHHDDLESLLDFVSGVVADYGGYRIALTTFYLGDGVFFGEVGCPEGTKERFRESFRRTDPERRNRKRQGFLRYCRPGTNVCFVPEGEGPRPSKAYIRSRDRGGGWLPDDRLVLFMRDWEDRILGTVSLDEPRSGNRPGEEEFRKLADIDRFMNVVAKIAENRFWSLRLKESEETFRGVFESASDALIVMDPDGSFVEANPAATRMYGYSRMELLRMSPRDLVRPEEHDKINLFLERTTAGEEVHFETHETRKDGTSLTADVRGVAYQHQGRPRILAVVRDVTEQRRVAERLRERQREESVVSLAGGVAHDFNNLLLGFTGSLDLLEREIPPDSGAMRQLHRLGATAEKLTHLTGQLLAIAQGVHSEPRPLSLSWLVEDNLVVLRGLAQSRSRLEVGVPENLWPVHADEVQMGQVLLNLVQNSCEAAGRDGVVHILGDNHEVTEPWLCLLTGNHPAGDYVRLVVEDDGRGMDEPTLSRAFEPYFSTRDRGSGLGLAAVLGIVRRHGAAISVRSEPDRGTRVEILLPRSERAAEETPAAASGDERTGGTLSVLLVDDEPLVRDVAREMLRALGHEVTVAESGAEAVEIYRESGDEIDLVLLDMLMPGMTGLETCEALREIDPDVSVVLSSGHTEQRIRGDDVPQGKHVGFIQKPYTLADLGRAIQG